MLMKLNIVRAWKDEVYRRSLSEEQYCRLPANPVGELELTDADLSSIYGGGIGDGLGTWGSGEIVNGQMHSFALRCKNELFSVTVVTGTNTFHPVTIICVKDNSEV